GRLEGAHRASDAFLGQADRKHQDAEAGAPQRELERLDVERLDVEQWARVEQEDAVVTRGRRHDALDRVHPAGRPAAGHLVLGLAAVAVVRELERRDHEVLDAALDGADGEALLHDAVRGQLVEAVEGVHEASGRAGPLAALTGDLNRRRDVVRLEQRTPERLELGELVLAVAACRAARAGVPEATLPTAESVGADAEKLGSCIGSNTAHAQRPPGKKSSHVFYA